MRTVNLSKDDAQLAALVDQALSGEDIVFAREGRPLVRLVPVNDAPAAAERRFGQLRGQVRMGDDFNDPLPEEVLKAFRGEGP